MLRRFYSTNRNRFSSRNGRENSSSLYCQTRCGQLQFTVVSNEKANALWIGGGVSCNFLCCFVQQRSGADEDQTFWSLLLVGIGQLGVGRRERLISISITVAIIIIMIINVIIITIVTTIITIIGVGELGERERVYLGKQKLFQLIYQII